MFAFIWYINRNPIGSGWFWMFLTHPSHVGNCIPWYLHNQEGCLHKVWSSSSRPGFLTRSHHIGHWLHDAWPTRVVLSMKHLYLVLICSCIYIYIYIYLFTYLFIYVCIYLYHIISYYIISYYIISDHIISYHLKLYYIIVYSNIIYYIIL